MDMKELFHEDVKRIDRQLLICTNCPKEKYGESAEIQIINGKVRSVYYSPYGERYDDHFATVRGAKSSMSRYLKIRTQWKVELFPSQESLNET